MMEKTKLNELTRRENQAMDVVYANEEVTVAEVQSLLPGEPSYSAVRAVMSWRNRWYLLEAPCCR